MNKAVPAFIITFREHQIIKYSVTHVCPVRMRDNASWVKMRSTGAEVAGTQ